MRPPFPFTTLLGSASRTSGSPVTTSSSSSLTFSFLPSLGATTAIRRRSFHLSPPRRSELGQELKTERDHADAREWLESFSPGSIPPASYSVTRSRSSGPGGQHVNKTESKVTLRCRVDWLPCFVRMALIRSPHYLPSPPSLLITSQTSRTASQNLKSALGTLHETIVSAARSQIQGETSQEQKARVRGLARRENQRRLEGKKRNAAKKAARREI